MKYILITIVIASTILLGVKREAIFGAVSCSIGASVTTNKDGERVAKFNWSLGQANLKSWITKGEGNSKVRIAYITTQTDAQSSPVETIINGSTTFTLLTGDGNSTSTCSVTVS